MVAKPLPDLSPLVCVVEPDADVREFLVHILENQGYRCEGFVSAERFQSSPAQAAASCVIVDADLPGKNGLDLAREVHRSERPVPVMLLAPEPDRELLDQARSAAVARVQVKPIKSISEFLQAVASAIAFAAML